jgi:hypothetical protein
MWPVPIFLTLEISCPRFLAKIPKALLKLSLKRRIGVIDFGFKG